MNFELKARVFCHDLLNPPAPDRDVNITLELKNSTLIEFTKSATSSSESVYSLSIQDTQSVGFIANGDSPFEPQFDNLILAFNLLLPRVCINIQSPRFSSFDKRYRVPESVTKSVVLRKDHKVFVNITEEHLLITERVHAAIFHTSSADEPSVINIFQRLQRLNRATINSYSSKEDFNLKKSLESFERAMYSIHKESTFRDLFTSLEKITDIHGKGLKGPDFDRQASILSGTQSKNIERWRHLNNRLKHSSRNTDDAKMLEEEEINSPTMLTDIRRCVNAVILSKI